MREQLAKYIDLLFAGASDAEEIKQEILQNTLDRYDDLISQGKSPESAYSLAISGIGDISEILGGGSAVHQGQPAPSVKAAPEEKKEERNIRLIRAVAIMFFILCPIPVIILENIIGVCLLLAMVAAGVALLVIFEKDNDRNEGSKDTRSPAHKLLHGITWGAGLALYFGFSFASGAWYISWLIFPIIGSVCGLISACFDLNKVFLSAVVRIVLFGLLTLVLCACLFGGYLGVNLVSYVDEKYQQVDGTAESSGSVSAQQIKDIEIQWVSGSITFVPGDVQDIQFRETGSFDEDDTMVWKQSGDRLIIQFHKPTFHFINIGSSFSKDLTVTVPRDWICDELEIDSVSARIEVKSLQAREVDLVNVSGSCSLTQCNAEEFSAETVSGNIRYEGSLQILDFNTVSANCTAQLTGAPKDIELESVSGDLTLILPESCGFTVEIDAVSGDFSSDYATTSAKNRHTYGDGSCKITADTVSGDVKIKKPQ